MTTLRKTAVSTTLMFVILAASAATAMPTFGDKIVDALANATLNAIQTSSCTEFAAKMHSRKSGGTSASGGMLKNNVAARQRFVNKVAGPLVNKLIDCGMLPAK